MEALISSFYILYAQYKEKSFAKFVLVFTTVNIFKLVMPQLNIFPTD